MNFLSIKINGAETQLGSQIPNEVYSLSIDFRSIFPQPIERTQAVLIKQWLNNLVDNITSDYVSFNGTLIPTNELNKFKL